MRLPSPVLILRRDFAAETTDILIYSAAAVITLSIILSTSIEQYTRHLCDSSQLSKIFRRDVGIWRSMNL